MRSILCLFLLALSIPSKAEVFSCGVLEGVTKRSTDNFQAIIPDGVGYDYPVVEIDSKNITISNPKVISGSKEIYKVPILHRNAVFISGVGVDTNSSITDAVLITVDLRRGYLYLSTHRDNGNIYSTYVSSFVSKCSKKLP